MLKRLLNSRGSGNVILQSLSPTDFALIAPLLRPISFEAHRPLNLPTPEREWVLFPASGLISVFVSNTRKNHSAEASLIGRDGLIGVGPVLGWESLVFTTFVQVSGTGGLIKGEDLLSAMRESATLRETLFAAAHAIMIQIAGTSLASSRSNLHQRLARWLLMAHDRVPGDTLYVTHGSIALALGVRRAGVTKALCTLESNHLVSVLRAQIRIENREGLEIFCNDFYGFPEEEYARVILTEEGEEVTLT
jgi:hypothetical protein